MADKRAIKVSTLDELAEGFQESRGITDKLTIKQMIAFAKEPVGGGENKLAKVLDSTITEITANDLEGVTQLRNYAFYHQYELKSIEMANTISGRVGDFAFSNCINLERVVISDNVDRLNRYCFNECKKLTDKSIDFGSGLTWIYDYCFYNCTGLESITFPNQINTFGNYIFQGCTNLKTVRIGNGVRDYIYAISSLCFQYADNITDIYIDAPENSVYNAPWGATKATVHWNTPLPSEET